MKLAVSSMQETDSDITEHKSDTAQELTQLFNQCFQQSERTLIKGGAEEPLYQPADSKYACHQVIFRENYSASALHEIAHWCIAGPKRRLMLDYGYWYIPDGRSEQQQRNFESLEIKPQALEWIFASAAKGCRFNISVDNLGGHAFDLAAFKTNVYQQVLKYLSGGLPDRAMIFLNAVQAFYGSNVVVEDFKLEQI